jgi:pyruvate dehydrogenase E2 component (dihydrolipoamide acetyltransferase)
MSAEGIAKLTMPKWGLSMTEGTVLEWLVDEGAEIASGQEIAEVETDKLSGAVEAQAAGTLRKQVAQAGEKVPVGGLLGVVAPAEVSDDDVEAFVADFVESFEPEEEADTGPQPETVEVDGRRIRYLRHGEGAPIVLLHGFGGDLDNWLFNRDALAEAGEVVAIDLPGHGGSAKEIRDGGLDELTGVLGGVLDALGLERVHLVGHSLGGAVAAAWAGEHPDRVASLTLIAGAGLGEAINAEYVEGFLGARSRKQLRPVLALLFADPDRLTRQLVDDVLKFKRLDGVDAALRSLAGTVFPDGRQAIDVRAALGSVDAPVLVIWGGQDRILDPAHADGLPDGVRVERLADAGHSPQMEVAGEVNRLLTAHVQGAG